MRQNTNEFQSMWSSDWAALMSYRQSLMSWQEDLAFAREKYARTKCDAYLDEIRNARQTIGRIENKICVLKQAIVNDTYDPYQVLGLAEAATGQELYETYSRLYDAEQDVCMRWYSCLIDAHSEVERIIFSNKLDGSRYLLQQLVKAYKTLKALNPFTPPVPWYERLLISKPSF